MMFALARTKLFPATLAEKKLGSVCELHFKLNLYPFALSFFAMEIPSSTQISSDISVKKAGTFVQMLILIYFLL